MFSCSAATVYDYEKVDGERGGSLKVPSFGPKKDVSGRGKKEWIFNVSCLIRDINSVKMNFNHQVLFDIKLKFPFCFEMTFSNLDPYA